MARPEGALPAGAASRRGFPSSELPMRAFSYLRFHKSPIFILVCHPNINILLLLPDLNRAVSQFPKIKLRGSMGQSITKMFMHIMFSTRNRLPLINRDIEQKLFRFLENKCRDLDSPPEIAGGYLDHVHILCDLSKKITLIDFMEKIKKQSSFWIKTKGSYYEHFYWNDGYSALSVSPSEVPRIVKLIENQSLIHEHISYKEELLKILDENGADYDQRFLWR